ncbi:MAG: arsenate reductase ArsC [Desulfamplus sp.]|nr:arsenate reductase ArsC [Desulfamplus sp.]MBF0390551.1 arsenate reductase ArsC [Desulfamplus sp.]
MGAKIKVLFICVHNSARSQMAEAFLQELGGESFIVESAGLEAGVLNPLAVAVMKEIGIDISGNKTKSAFEFFKQGRLYNYVITVCDESAEKRCPIFPGITKRIHWGFDDPSSLTGSEDEKLATTRKIRDQIKEAVENFIKEVA